MHGQIVWFQRRRVYKREEKKEVERLGSTPKRALRLPPLLLPLHGNVLQAKWALEVRLVGRKPVLDTGPYQRESAPRSKLVDVLCGVLCSGGGHLTIRLLGPAAGFRNGVLHHLCAGGLR